jgi:hypothetical protein
MGIKWPQHTVGDHVRNPYFSNPCVHRMGAGMAVSNDGTLLVTISHDKSVKIFDVVNFDMMSMLVLPFVPQTAEWIYKVRRMTASRPMRLARNLQGKGLGWWLGVPKRGGRARNRGPSLCRLQLKGP